MVSPTPVRIVLFDVDGTLTRHDSLFPFLRFVLGTPAFVARLPACLPALLAMAAGWRSRQDAKEHVLAKMLGGRHLSALQEQGRAFAMGPMERLLRPAGLQRLREHQQQGDRCVLVSASLDLWLRPWAEHHGLKDVISSRLAVDRHGIVHGRLDGTNCQGAAKPVAIRAWLERLDPSEAVDLYAAYGDSAGDLPMLQMVRHGYRWRRGAFRPIDPHTQGPT